MRDNTHLNSAKGILERLCAARIHPVLAVTEADVGRRVIYRTIAAPTERGVITSLGRPGFTASTPICFVRYDTQHPEAPGQASPLAALEWDDQ